MLWKPGSLTVQELPNGGAADTYATGRNRDNLVVGWQIQGPGSPNTAIYWPSPSRKPVVLPGRVAFAVNDEAQIAGIRDFAGSTAFPFSGVLWDPARKRTHVLGDNGQGSYVVALNASGRSAGYALATANEKTYNTAGWWEAPKR